MKMHYISTSDLGHKIVIHEINQYLAYDLFKIDVPELGIYGVFVKAHVINASIIK